MFHRYGPLSKIGASTDVLGVGGGVLTHIHRTYSTKHSDLFIETHLGGYQSRKCSCSGEKFQSVICSHRFMIKILIPQQVELSLTE